jgi:hypothetical protein
MSNPDYSGETYMREHKYQWMNDDQFECYKMLCDLFGGSHHVFDKVEEACDNGIRIKFQLCSFATFDFSNMTTAVFMAHDRGIRFEIGSMAPSGKLELSFHKRDTKSPDTSRRHPTLEQALERYKKDWHQEK